jgi:hypothetical protein
MYNIKCINAQQAKTVYSFKNIKEKLLKTNAAIWFKKKYAETTSKPLNIQSLKGMVTINKVKIQKKKMQPLNTGITYKIKYIVVETDR